MISSTLIFYMFINCLMLLNLALHQISTATLYAIQRHYFCFSASLFDYKIVRKVSTISTWFAIHLKEIITAYDLTVEKCLVTVFSDTSCLQRVHSM